jgi:hypothetical protein
MNWDFKILKKDSFVLGIVLAIGSLIISALILLVAMYIIGKDYTDDRKIFIFSFVLPILLMRQYFKNKILNTAFSILFVLLITMILFFVWLLRASQLYNIG